MIPSPLFHLDRDTDDDKLFVLAGDSHFPFYCTALSFLPEGHEDWVPFLMNNNLLRQDSLGAGLFLHQVVFAHEHPVGELGAGAIETERKWP